MSGRRATIAFLVALFLIALCLAIVITRPFLEPFAFAIILAVVFYPLHERMRRLIPRRTGLSALCSTLLVFFLFGVPLFIVMMLAANEALAAAHYLSRRSIAEGGFTALVMNVADRPVAFIGRWVDLKRYDLQDIIATNAQRVSVWMVGFGAAVLGNVARFIVNSLITFAVLFFLFRDGKGWAYRLGGLMPLSPQRVDRLYRNVTDTIVANVYGILTVSVVQGVLTGIAMRIVGMPSSILLGLAAAFTSIIPVVGSSLVWVPVAAYLLVTGAVWKGVFLLVWGTVVVSSVDNIVRPWVVGGRVELHPMVLLFFIFGGVEAFGFLGLFLGPVVASVLYALFRMLREEAGEENILANAPA